MRTASVWACSVGMAIASSKHESAIDCTPPSAAASAWIAARTMLFSGCWSVSVDPAVCVCVRSIIDRGSVAPNRSRMTCAHSRRRARYLAISSKKSMCVLKIHESRGANSSTPTPRSTTAET